MKLVKGTLVEYKSGFGAGAIKRAAIESIVKCEKGEKYGDDVDSANLVDVQDSDRYVIDLNDNHWAYGNQILRVIK